MCICVIATAILLICILVLITGLRSKLPELVISTEGLSARTPAEAQTELRTQADSFAKIKSEHENCSFVWCGSDEIYLVRNDKLEHIKQDSSEKFERVRLYVTSGLRVRGYIIDPCRKSSELGRIELVDGKVYDLDTVSMSVRVGLRNGDIDYGDAVYLWEKGSREVIAVKNGSVTASAGETVSYLDDGEVRHECLVLDTNLN